MSTYSRSDKSITGERSVVSKRRQYSDVDLRLRAHPSHGDVAALKDIDAVKQSVRNLILTNKYERLFNPNLGSGIRALLFEPADYITMSSIRGEIEDVLTKYEPRIKLLSVDIDDRSEINAYTINIKFNIISITDDVEFEMHLERVR
mgnify:CR=1 FL=1|jgi:phage baseplate assembly protein W